MAANQGDTDHEQNSGRIPAGKLASVTKKKHSLEELLYNDPPNEELIRHTYNDYLIRVEALYEASDRGRHDEWLAPHKIEIDIFRDKVLRRMSTIRGEVITPSRSRSIASTVRSRSSLQSRASSISSSTRIRLAEKKAKTMADRKLLEKFSKFNEEELQLKREKLQLKQEKLQQKAKTKQLEQDKRQAVLECRELENKLLEEELDNIDGCDSADGSNASSVSSLTSSQRKRQRKRRTEAKKEHSPNRELIKVLEKQGELSELLARQQEQSSLPKQQLPVFDGTDITEYKIFKRNFERLIEKKCSSDADRLCYLEQYTTGAVQKLVKSCVHSDPSEAFSRAKALLDKEFDNEHKVAAAYLQTLHEWTVIKTEDVAALQDLYSFLLKCNNYLEDSSPFNQINNPQEIHGIVMKLPYKLREGWRRRTFHMHEESRAVQFCHLVEFVGREVNVLKQPLYGTIVSPDNSTKPKERNKKSFITTASERKPSYCECCTKPNHDISQCMFFKSKNYKEKVQFVKEAGLCFGCLSRGHTSKFCQERQVCEECDGRHPTIMHNNSFRNTQDSAASQRYSNNNHDNACDGSDHSCATSRADSANGAGADYRVMCPIVPAKVKCRYGDVEMIVNVALDTHSSDCWMNESLARKLGANPIETKIILSTMENVKRQLCTSIVRNLLISSVDSNKSTEIPIIYTKKQSCWPFSRSDIPSYDDVRKFPHLSDVPFDFIEADIDVLIGMNVPGLVKSYATVDGSWSEPFASLHWLGWALCGPVNRGRVISSCKRTLSNSFEIEQNIDKLFSGDFVESAEDDKSSVEDEIWLDKVKSSTVRLPSGNYQIDLPFRRNDICLPCNRENVRRRFLSVKRRFDKDSDHFIQYSAFMNLMLQKDFIEEIPDNELICPPGKVWYLPHHAVFHKQKGKIRIVFDCSAKFEGVSLNDELMQGPDLTNNLIDVLLKFRDDRCAFVSDIEKMYYQVKTPKRHWDFMRFFWLNPRGDIREYRLKVHVFGSRSSASVANFALKQVALDHAPSKLIHDSIFHNFYVDDLLKSCATSDECKIHFDDVKSTLALGGFNLTGFCSNFSDENQNISLDRTTDKFVGTSGFSGSSSKALGLLWDTNMDIFRYGILCKDDTQTRRSLLRTVASIYDPLGMVSPVIVSARRIFQESCRLRLGWDDVLPESLSSVWRKWCDNISIGSEYTVPRTIRPVMDDSNVIAELHTFCDGSEIAYGAVCYARFLSEKAIYVSCPIFSKARLTPLNKSTVKTIPRIELCGAKVAVDVSRIVVSKFSFKFNRQIFWTDSTTVLGYVTNESKRFHRFVSNKVAYIRAHSSPGDWKHVASESNPADLLSRGCTMKVLTSSNLWNTGPDFLRVTRSVPEFKGKFMVSDEDTEIKREKVILSTKLDKQDATDVLLASSSWYNVKVRVAWFRRYLIYLKTQSIAASKLSVIEIQSAEISILRYVQDSSFPTLKRAIIQKYVRENQLQKLNLFIDSTELVRIGGRLKNADAPYSFRHPVLLSAKSPIVASLVEYYHRSLGHLGKETVAAYVRRKYWIIGGNILIKKMIRSCVICRKYQARPNVQMMADLPMERVVGDVAAFSSVGVDYFGPFAIIHGRKSEKRYGVIFTCLASRAVHIEIAPMLCTNSFVNALRRFICRRGSVTKIYSDNGTNFVGGSNELKKEVESWNQNVIENWLKQRNIIWNFNSPCSSNHGGVWERLIRIIRKVFNSLLHEQRLRLSDDSLSTLMCEVESIINNRPLTPVSDDPNDCEALTPNHLLLLNSQVSFPPGLFCQSDLYCRRRWRQVQYLADVFWSRWRNEYLSLLQSRQKWCTEQAPLKEGDLVLVLENNLPRNQWQLGRVVEMLESTDGRFRKCRVKVTKYKDSSVMRLGTVTIERPVTKLIKLRSSEL